MLLCSSLYALAQLALYLDSIAMKSMFHELCVMQPASPKTIGLGQASLPAPPSPSQRPSPQPSAGVRQAASFPDQPTTTDVHHGVPFFEVPRAPLLCDGADLAASQNCNEGMLVLPRVLKACAMS